MQKVKQAQRISHTKTKYSVFKKCQSPKQDCSPLNGFLINSEEKYCFSLLCYVFSSAEVFSLCRFVKMVILPVFANPHGDLSIYKVLTVEHKITFFMLDFFPI